MDDFVLCYCHLVWIDDELQWIINGYLPAHTLKSLLHTPWWQFRSMKIVCVKEPLWLVTFFNFTPSWNLRPAHQPENTMAQLGLNFLSHNRENNSEGNSTWAYVEIPAWVSILLVISSIANFPHVMVLPVNIMCTNNIQVWFYNKRWLQ